MHVLLQGIFDQHNTGAAKGIGQDNIGASLQIGRINALDHIRSGDIELFVTPFIFNATKIAGREFGVLQDRTHGAVQH